LINSIIALAQCGFPIIFFIVFGDVAMGLLDRIDGAKGTFWSSRVFTQALLGIAMLFFVLMKEIHQLKYAGFFVLIGIIIFLVLLFIHFLTTDIEPDSKVTLAETSANNDINEFFASFPTLISSFAFQPSLFTAFASLRNKTNFNGIFATYSAIVIVYLVYISSPLLSFELYGNDLKANLLKNISEETDVIPTILCFLFLVIAIVHIPIIFFIGKEAVLIIFDELIRKSYSTNIHASPSTSKVADENGSSQSKSKNSESNSKHTYSYPIDREGEGSSNNVEVLITQVEEERYIPNPKEYLNMHPALYYIITIVLYTIVVILSIVVGDVSVFFFFGVIGATTGCFATFWGPGSFYW
jgi:amino acid permease